MDFHLVERHPLFEMDDVALQCCKRSLVHAVPPGVILDLVVSVDGRTEVPFGCGQRGAVGADSDVSPPRRTSLNGQEQTEGQQDCQRSCQPSSPFP